MAGGRTRLMVRTPSRSPPATPLARLRNLRRASRPRRARRHRFPTRTRKDAGTMRWTAVPIVLKPQLKVDGDRPVSAPLLNGTGNQDGGWSTEFLLYSLSPAMLTNLELDGELDVIHERPCEARFQRLFPIILLVPNSFWPSRARQRTSVRRGG